LCLKVRSKLITPRREIAFSKVAKLENESEKVEINEQGCLTLKVRFTQRPRAVFHKHADVMILVASLKSTKMEQPLLTDEQCLIFRGGTGSVHSADSRKKILEVEAKQSALQHSFSDGNSPSQSPNISYLQNDNSSPPLPHSLNNSNSSNYLSQYYDDSKEDLEDTSSLSISNPVRTDYTTASSIANEFLLSDRSQLQLGPEMTEMFSKIIGDIGPNNCNSNNASNSLDDISNPAWTNVDTPNGSNQTSILLSQTSQTDDVLLPIPDDRLSDLASTQQYLEDKYSGYGSPNDTAMIETPLSNSNSNDPLATTGRDASTGERFTIVFNKRRGKCSLCINECEQYQGAGGACSNCGCFPAQHVDLDKFQDINPKKRKRTTETDETAEEDEYNLPCNCKKRKRPQYLLESRFYQKLFFKSINFMTLDELSSIFKSAPLPFFVKDENSVYKYVNSAFCHFILDTARADTVLNKTTTQLLAGKEGEDIVKHDKYLLDREGEINVFSVSVHKQEYRVMKIFTTLRDGTKVVVGAVVSDFY